MRIALISDIHANLPALEAVLRDIAHHAPDRIISLGDQVNLGPCPRQTLQLLQAHQVSCLHGNHERYVLSAQAGDPAYEGANFASVRFNAALLSAQEITFPKTMQLEHVTLCHALPQDDRFPVFDASRAVKLLRDMTFERPTSIICGHGHNPTSVHMPNLSIQCIGSTGCMDHGTPGCALYSVLDIDRDAVALNTYHAVYDPATLHGLFRAGGMMDASPVMAHVACLQMELNRDIIMPFVTFAGQLAHKKGEHMISQETLDEADQLFGWPDGVSTAAFWH